MYDGHGWVMRHLKLPQNFSCNAGQLWERQILCVSASFPFKIVTSVKGLAVS